MFFFVVILSSLLIRKPHLADKTSAKEFVSQNFTKTKNNFSQIISSILTCKRATLTKSRQKNEDRNALKIYINKNKIVVI